MIFFHIILHPAVLVLVGWLSDKTGPFCALLITSTKISTDVPWVMPDRFGKGAKKSGVQRGGEGGFVKVPQSLTMLHKRKNKHLETGLSCLLKVVENLLTRYW